jgi:hypothetical protein
MYGIDDCIQPNNYFFLNQKNIIIIIILFILSQAYILSLLAYLLSLCLTSPLLLITNYQLNIDLAPGLITTSCVQVSIGFLSQFYQ